MFPLVSVVIPTYNRSSTLKRAIESVLSQSFKDFELIVVDDGSTDETNTVLAAYANDNRVRLLSQLHHGCATASNHGIRASRGRYIAIQGSDDEWMPENLERAIAVLDRAGPQVGVFYSDMIQVRKDGTFSYCRSPDVARGNLIDKDTLDFAVTGIGSGAAVIKRECYDNVGLYDERLPRLIDLDLFIRLSDHFDFFHHDEALVKWYEGEGISTDKQALLVARLYLLEKYHARLKLHNQHLAEQYLHMALALHSNARISESCAFALKAVLRYPFIFRKTFSALRSRGSIGVSDLLSGVRLLYRFNSI